MATQAAYLNVIVNAQTRKAQSELRRLDRQFGDTARTAQRTSKSVDRVGPSLNAVGTSARRASRGLRSMLPDLQLTTRIPVYKIAAIGTAIAAIIPPTVALAGALGPLTGLLAAIPSLASAAGQALGVIVLGARGVGDAIKASLDAQKTATKDAGAALKAQRSDAEGVRSAVQGVTDAQRGLADSHRAVADAQRGVADAQRGVEDAERGLADAQRQTKGAQEDLNRARQEAARDLIDMRLAVQGAALSEKEARVELARAIQEQTRVLGDAASSSLDIRDAELAVQRARLGLRESTIEAGRSQKDFNKAQKEGVAGSERVVEAQQSLQDAQRGVADAQRGVVEANRGVADAHRAVVDAGRGVTDAQRALVEATRQVRVAQRDQAAGAAEATAGMTKYQEAMQGLPKAAQNFVRFIVGLKPKIDELRDAAASGIFPGLTKGIQASLKNFGVFRKVIGETSAAIGDLSEQAGRQLGSADWGRDLEIQGERNVQTITRLGTAGLNLADALRHITLAAGPMVSFLTRSAVQLSVMVEKWAQAGRESGRLQAFFERTVTATKLTVEALWDFSRALINIGTIAARVWGNDLLVNINKAAETFRKWTESVRGSQDIENFFIRWRRRWGDITAAIGNVIDKYQRLRKEGATVGEALVVVFSDAAVKIMSTLASQVGQAAPHIALAFVKGFLAADIWGKLFIGGWLVAKLGGFRAMVGVGASMAASFWTGFGGAAAGGAAGKTAAGGVAGGLMTKLKGFAKGAGVLGIGVLIADSVIKGFQDRAGKGIQEALGKLTGESGLSGMAKKLFGLGPLPDQFSKSEEAAQGLARAIDEIAKSGRGISSARAKELRGEINKLTEASPQLRQQLRNMVEGFDKTGEGAQRVRVRIRELRTGGSENIEFLKNKVQFNTKLIREHMGTNSKRGKEAMIANFQAAADNVRKSMRAGTIATKEGLQLIETYMLKALRLMGFSKKDALALQRRVPGSKQTPGPGGRGELRPNQRGSFIDEGQPFGDSVPSLLERGEYVLNRNAVKKVGRKQLDALNFGAAPRFQKGGFSGMIGAANRVEKAQFPYLWGGGHQATPAPFGPFDCSGAVSYVLQQGGVNIPTMVSGAMMGIGKPGAGQVTIYADPGHVLMSIGGKFFGTSGTNPGGGAGWIEPKPSASYLSRFTKRHFGSGDITGMLGAEAPNIKRAELAGPASPLKGVAQGALDTARAAAQSVVDKLAVKASVGTGDPGDAGTYSGPLNRNFGKGNSAKIAFDDAAMLAERAGLPGVTYAQIAIGESGLRPGAVSPDGGFGLWQMTPRVQSAATVSAWERIGSYFNPWNNARMAKVLAGSGTGTSNYYGTGSVTDWNKHYTGPMKGLKRGGLVQMLQAGGDPTTAKTSTAGGLSKAINKTLRTLQRSEKPKIRDKALQGLLERIKGIEVPNAEEIAQLQLQTTSYGEFADRANSLTLGLDTTMFQNMTADQMRPFAEAHLGSMTPRQQALFEFSGRTLGQLDDGALVELLDTPVWGQVGGKTQAEWLETQLETLRILRNALVDAERQIIARRQRVIELIAQAQKRLDEVAAEIAKAARTKRRLENALEAIEGVSGGKAPAKARQIVKDLKGDIPEGTWKTLKEAVDSNKPAANLRDALKGEIREVVERQKPRVRERDALENQIIPALGLRRDALTEALESQVQPSLLEVQGSVADEIRTKVFSQLPELGVLGGQIFDVQMSLRDLGVKKILSVAQPEAAETGAESESAELLRELLRQANLRTAVSQLQYDVFKNFPPFGGQFAEGGVVPGPVGAPRMILAHGQETVTPPGAGGDITIRAIFPPGTDWLKDKIRFEVEHVTRSQARGAARGLSGRGGGLQR